MTAPTERAPARAPLATLESLGPLKVHRVLVRSDLKVPFRQGDADMREVADDFGLRASVSTLDRPVAAEASVTVCSHLGRPHGHVDPRYSMDPVRRALARLAPAVEVRENLRFDAGEESNDPGFVDDLVLPGGPRTRARIASSGG